MSELESGLPFFKREPHLDLIAYSQVGHTNFCYKYCALMIDIAHGKVGRGGWAGAWVEGGL